MRMSKISKSIVKKEISLVSKGVLRKTGILKIGKFPKAVQIETINTCNAKCISCPYRKGMKRRPEILDFNLYKKIINEIGKYDVWRIDLHVFGEPLLNPKLEEYIRYAKTHLKRTEVWMSTNFSIMTKQRGENIINSGLDNLLVCVDAFSKLIYENIKELDYDVVKQNILDFLESLKKIKNHMLFRIAFIPMSENKDEQKNFFDFWKFKTKGMKNVLVQLKAYEDFGSQVEKQNSIMESYKSIRRKVLSPCNQIYNMLDVLSNGNVSCCCYDMEGEINLGNIKNQTLFDIWNSEKFKALRKHIESRDYELLPDLCINCIKGVGK